ncbi:hypothetical protein ACMA1D_06230 [Streptomyces sp. 796.1]|uniref:hypothetical protein n=1 Tax=Streptomyces sp. 796.1 TaxID=3163029 RepID=UPI0039C9A12B
MSAAENLSDLQKHADDFERRDGFTYSVLDDQDEVVGCVYIYPVNSGTEQAQVRSWVSADRADLDGPVYEAVSDWLELVWPFDQVRYRPTT